ncbi:MAG: carbohydrate kinase family protein [Eubacteriales bacterium]|nr:carbohydrate kinase family protein [Eubacteriales bacterium]
MKREKIIVMGAAIVDVLVRPASQEIFRTGSYPVEDIHMSTGGDALNEATILARFGKQVELRTVIGDDLAGKLVLEHCREAGIALGPDVVRPGMPTGVNVVLVQENGERGFFTNPHGSLRMLALEDVQGPFPEDAGILCFASVFVSPKLKAPELARIFRRAKEQGLVVCADMTKKKGQETVEELAPALQYLDYLFPNEAEACLLTGKTTAEEAAEELFAAGVGHVVVKCGGKGCYVRSRELTGMVPAVDGVKCVDTTGAGDSFAAGFLYGLSEGDSLAECAGRANRFGARAVASVGATDWSKGKAPWLSS